MRSRLYRHLQISCVGFIGVAIGLLVGSRVVKVPGVVRPPLHQPGEAEEAIMKVIPEVELEGTPFTEAVVSVRHLSSVPIVVNWVKLAAAGLDAKSPVTFRARNATLGRVLSELVNAIETSQQHAAYAPAGDVILISTADDAEPRAAVVRSYDVRDLMRLPADAWQWDPRYRSPAFSSPPSAAGNLFGSNPLLEDDLQRLIEATVSPDSWRDQGSQFGSMRIFAGRLIVTQTWENHRQIASLLAELREPAPLPAPPPTLDLNIWNDTLKKYVSANRPVAEPDLSIWNDTLKKYVSTDPSAAESALRRHLPEVRFDDTPLDEAIATLANLAHADVVADWSAFETAGAGRQTPVSMQLSNVTLAEALRALLDAGGSERIHFRIDGGCVILGIPNGGEGTELTVRVYDFRDWLAAVMGASPVPAPKSPSDLAAWAHLRYSHVDALIKIIEGTVAPDSWKETGGEIGAIREINSRLVVTQTWENQERVADLLAALRADPSRLRVPAKTALATQP